MDSSSRRHHNSPPTSFHHHHHHHNHYHHEVSPDCPFHASLLQSNRHRHHHHHFELSPHCPLHSSLLQPNSHHRRQLLPHCPLQISPSLQINQSHHSQVFPNFGSPVPFPSNPNLALNNLNSQVPETNEIFVSEVLKEELELEDEVEYEFVLTDEWKEFFAKSEAKRTLAKKQAKRKGKC